MNTRQAKKSNSQGHGDGDDDDDVGGDGEEDHDKHGDDHNPLETLVAKLSELIQLKTKKDEVMAANIRKLWRKLSSRWRHQSARPVKLPEPLFATWAIRNIPTKVVVESLRAEFDAKLDYTADYQSLKSVAECVVLDGGESLEDPYLMALFFGSYPLKSRRFQANLKALLRHIPDNLSFLDAYAELHRIRAQRRKMPAAERDPVFAHDLGMDTRDFITPKDLVDLGRKRESPTATTGC